MEEVPTRMVSSDDRWEEIQRILRKGVQAVKLGSLFDGSGGFPLAGSLCGIEPVWAAEVEPYPIAVTRSRFPHILSNSRTIINFGGKDNG